MKILRAVSQGPILLVLIKNILPGGVYYTRNYGKVLAYILVYVLMVFIVPFIRNWKALNIFRPVENFHMISKQKYQN